MYEEINKSIFDHFLLNSQGSDTFIMAFDDDDLALLANKINKTEADVLNIITDKTDDSWDKFFSYHKPFPQYYGLIALQILCMSRMGYNKKFTDREYNPILSEMLCIKEIKLQELFSRFQEKLWEQAQVHIKSLGFTCDIPKPKSHAHRYIQYPKSQAYLNGKDLQKLSGLFLEKDLKPNMNINLADFSTLLQITDIDGLYNIKGFLTTHASRILAREEFQLKIFQTQLYNYYLKWNGEYDFEEKTTKYIPSHKLFFDESLGFYIIDHNTEIVIADDVNFKGELLRKYIIRKSTQFLLLKRNQDWGDYEEVKRVAVGDKVLILILKECILEQYIPKDGGDYTTFEYGKLPIHKFTVPPLLHDSFRSKVISSAQHPLEWLSGIKLNRNTYLYDFGPKYQATQNCIIWINGKLQKLEKGKMLDLSQQNIGHYELQAANARKISFSINSSKLQKTSDQYCSGWNLETFEHQEEGWHLSGLHTKQYNNEVTIRKFIDLSIGKNGVKTRDYDNIIMKILSTQK